MILISIANDGSGYPLRTFLFTGDAVVIGRAPDADLVLAQSGVAPRHIRLSRRGGELIAEDLRSGVRQRPEQVLRSGDGIRVGGLTLRIALDELDPDVADATEQGLLDELRRRPDDPATRAVYADWLEEHDQAARAEFLRLQLAVGAVASAEDPAFAQASARLAELAKQVGDGWRVRVAMSFIEPQTCPTRGPAIRASMWGRSKPAPPALGMELVCPMRWDMLEPTEREGARRCRACNTEVTYCTTIEQAATAAQEGRCIAIDLGAPRSRFDLERPSMVGRPTPPCSHYGKPAR